jgi:hypothetical protein
MWGTLCRELIGFDLTTEKDLKRARESDVFNEKCVHFISNAVKILLDLTDDPDITN